MTSTRRPPAGTALTGREVEVLREIARGLTNREIARRLHITGSSVQTHVRRILRKLSAVCRAHAVARGYERGVLIPAYAAAPQPGSPEGR